MGSRGQRGRLLWVDDPNVPEWWVFVFYRGTSSSARVAVAGCEVERLRELHDGRQDVERRIGRSSSIEHALGLALDLPPGDVETRTLAAYLAESTAGSRP